jgi:sugar-phosphatase
MDISVDALLFDMDGTLVDSTPAVERCWRTWIGEYGVPAERFASIRLHGRPAADIIADLLPPERLAGDGAEQALRRIEELEVADTEGTTALPGARALLAVLPVDRWAVVTSATARLAKVRLAAGAIEPPVLVSADDITRGKPDPEPFLLGAALLGVEPARCLVLEDAPAGVAAARAAGMRCVAVSTTHPREVLDADVVVDSLESLRVLPGREGGLLVDVRP